MRSWIPILLLAGCVSTGGDTFTSGGESDADLADVADADDSVEGDGAEEDAEPEPPPTVTVAGRAVNLVGDAPVEGVEACVQDHPEIGCTTTDEEGGWALEGVPADSELIFVLTKGGYFPELLPVATTQDELGLPITSAHASQIEADAVPRIVGLVRDETRGHVGLAVFAELGQWPEQMLAGATVSIDPQGPEATYLAKSGLPDTALNFTSENARLFFFNVPPGEVVLTVFHPTHKGCEIAGFGWLGEDPQSVRLPVQAGHVTAAALVCKE